MPIIFQTAKNSEGFLVPFYEDPTNRLDIEKFIFTLSMEESMVLTLLSLGYSFDEIKDVMGFKNAGSVRKITMEIRNKYKKEQNR